MRIKGSSFLKLFAILAIILGVTTLIPTTISGAGNDISISAVGDCLLFRKVSNQTDTRFLQLVEILRRADCTYGNCETNLFKAEEGFPAYKGLDPNVYSHPLVADELQWLGIDLMSLANNHIMDFDYDGLFSTLHHLDRVGIRYAGAGKDLYHAARPGIFHSKAGPVGLVSCSSWLPEKNHQASLSSAYMKGKPGLNPLNVDFQIQLPTNDFNMLKKMKARIIKELGIPEEAATDKDADHLKMMNNNYARGDKVEILLSPDKNDHKRIIESIKIAKGSSRIVLVSQHEHIGNFKETRPTAFQETFARQCIDAGADMFVGTGAHHLWGIEIYKGKPIFYCLGNLFFQTLPIISPEAYQKAGMPFDSLDAMAYEKNFDKYFEGVPIWDSVVPVVTFDAGNRLKEIKLYPIHLDGEKALYSRGTPKLALPDKAQAIIENLIKISTPYKTRITYKNGIGTVTVK
ncbi:MAG: CapA family protein [bacterium]|nr:CapA family protein [bacterium]